MSKETQWNHQKATGDRMCVKWGEIKDTKNRIKDCRFTDKHKYNDFSPWKRNPSLKKPPTFIT